MIQRQLLQPEYLELEFCNVSEVHIESFRHIIGVIYSSIISLDFQDVGRLTAIPWDKLVNNILSFMWIAFASFQKKFVF